MTRLAHIKDETTSWGRYVKEELDQLKSVPFSNSSLGFLKTHRRKLLLPPNSLELIRSMKKSNLNFLDECVNSPLVTSFQEHPRRMIMIASTRLLKCMDLSYISVFFKT